MKKLTLITIIAVVVGIIGVFVYKFGAPILKARNKNKADIETSDARATKGRITIGVDSWAGYFPLRSQRLKKEMLREGYLLVCEDDKADYKSRMDRLEKGEFDLIVATVDTYILNAVKAQYPGAIIAVIDESKGDAICAYKDAFPNLEALKTNKIQKIAFTPNSASHHLLKVAGAHFDIPVLRTLPSKMRLETEGSEGALDLLKNRKVSIAVLWEPDVSKALEIPGVEKLLGTEQTKRVVVDVAIANRKIIQEHPETLDILLKAYFRVLKYYNSNSDDLRNEFASEMHVKTVVAEKSIQGVRWVTLTENAESWFGISSQGQTGEQGLVDTIESTVEILIDAKDFSTHPIPKKNPYHIINSDFIKNLYKSGVRFGFTNLAPAALGTGQGIEARFSVLSETAWRMQKPIGTMKIEPINFKSGTGELTLEGKEELDRIAAKIKHYPTFRIGVSGHTDIGGDEETSKILSKERADAVAKYFEATYSVDPNRMYAVGHGGSRPLPRLPDEPDRAYGFRLRRVEITLLTEVY